MSGEGRGRYSWRGWRGRDREWAAVAELLRAAETGRGGVLLVEGQSGMGKSRLLAEAADAAAGRGFALAQGAADEHSRLTPLRPLTSALGESGDTVPPGRLEPVDKRLWLVERLQDRLEQRAGRGPLLITLDDLHWADPTTLLALRALVPELSSYPLIWILSRTSGGDATEADWSYDALERGGARRILLDELDEQAVIEIVIDVVGAEPESGLMALAEGAAGNPFMLVELLDGLRDEGAVEITDGRARLISSHVPKRVQELIRERLDALPDRTRSLLQVAAVLGRSIFVDDLAGMLRESPGRLLPVVQEAEATGALVSAGETMTFRHDLIRQAILETMGTRACDALHGQAGEMLLKRGGSAIPAATHLMHYARPGDAHALTGLDRAAREVLASSPQIAADLAVRALDLTPRGDPDRFDRAVTAVYALAAAARAPDAADLARAAMREAALPDQRARLRYELAHAFLLSGRPEETVAEVDQAAAEPDLSAQVRDFGEDMLFRGLFAGRDYTRGRERARTFLNDPRHHGRPAVIGARMRLAQSCLAEGSAADAIEHLNEAVRLAADGPIRAQHTHPRLFLAGLLNDLRRFDEAERNLRTATDEIAALGHTAFAASPSFFRARLRLAEGRLDDAAVEAQAGLDMAEELGMYGFVLLGISVLAIDAIRRDDLAAASGFAERYESHHRSENGVTFGQARTDLAMALVAEATKSPAKAIDMVHGAYADASERNWLLMAEPNAAPWLTRLALVTADRTGAEVIAATAERLARGNPGFPTLAASAAQAHGILHGDPESLSRAVAAHVGPWSRASAAEDLGSVLAHSGATSDAIRSLDEAREGYRWIGASRDAARVRVRLRKLGVRRRLPTKPERPVVGWDSLTDTERDIVALVAQGLTNSQVAARMYVSPHTVKFHLRRVFRKLGIGSRVELARVAAERRV